MDYLFISEICSAYYDDRTLYNLDKFKKRSDIVDNLISEMKLTMSEIKAFDEDLYLELHIESRTSQQRMIYLLLDQYLCENYIEEASIHVGGQEYDLNKNYNIWAGETKPHQISPQLTSPSEYGFEVPKLSSNAPSDLHQHIPSSDSHHPYLSFFGDHPIISGILSFWLIPILLSAWFPKWTSKVIGIVAEKLKKLTDSINKSMTSFTATPRVRNALLITHLDKCTKKCGELFSSYKDLENTIPAAIKSGVKLPISNMPQKPSSNTFSNVVQTIGKSGLAIAKLAVPKFSLSTVEAQRQAKCIISCYLDYVLETIKFVAGNYVQCLKSTGVTGPKDSYSLLMQKPLGEKCKVYYDNLVEINKSFDETIEVLFETDPEQKQIYIRRFHEAISSALGGSDSRPSFTPPQQVQRSNQPPQRQVFVPRH